MLHALFRVTIYTTNYNQEDNTKSSQLEFERVQAGNAGEYKCVVGGGTTFGGAESEIALIRISWFINVTTFLSFF